MRAFNLLLPWLLLWTKQVYKRMHVCSKLNCHMCIKLFMRECQTGVSKNDHPNWVRESVHANRLLCCGKLTNTYVKKTAAHPKSRKQRACFLRHVLQHFSAGHITK